MNLYLLLAFAFGAFAGTADAPIARATVILSRANAEGSQVARKEILRSVQSRSAALPLGVRVTLAPAAVADAPLTGAASPRAPATIG